MVITERKVKVNSTVYRLVIVDGKEIGFVTDGWKTRTETHPSRLYKKLGENPDTTWISEIILTQFHAKISLAKAAHLLLK